MNPRLPTDPPAATDPPEVATGAVVRLALDVLLDTTRDRRMCGGLVVSCSACRTSLALGTIGPALDALARHVYGHHHQGPKALV
jgi:hypothetical protein